jgi:hypothetical protein
MMQGNAMALPYFFTLSLLQGHPIACPYKDIGNFSSIKNNRR